MERDPFQLSQSPENGRNTFVVAPSARQIYLRVSSGKQWRLYLCKSGSTRAAFRFETKFLFPRQKIKNKKASFNTAVVLQVHMNKTKQMNEMLCPFYLLMD